MTIFHFYDNDILIKKERESIEKIKKSLNFFYGNGGAE